MEMLLKVQKSKLNKMQGTTDDTNTNVSKNEQKIDEYNKKLNELNVQWREGKVSLADIKQLNTQVSQLVKCSDNRHYRE